MLRATALLATVMSLLASAVTADDAAANDRELSDRELREVEALLDALPTDRGPAFEYKADSLTEDVDGDSLVSAR